MKILTKLLLAGSMITGAAAVKADPAAQHGMLLFGQETTYVSHLPMFHAPHDYQFVAELSIQDEPRSDTINLYELAKSEGETLFTLLPEAMDLTKLITGEITKFRGLIFQGHFERGGSNLGPVIIDVKKIIYTAKLDGGQPQNSSQSYVIFGQDQEYFAAHIIQSKPSFDAILKIQSPYQIVENQNCRFRQCRDQIRIPVRSGQLPAIISTGDGNLELDLPIEGMELGHLGGIQSIVDDLIYIELEELEN